MNKKIWTGVAVVVIVLAIWIYKSRTPQVTDSNPLKVGAALALTGDAATWGEAEKNGINLALNEINANGGINGRKMEAVFEDTKSSSKDSITAVQKLASFDGLTSIIGPTWLDSYPGAQGVVKGKDVLMITPSASITAVQQGEPVKNVFSMWYRVDAITDGLAKAIKAQGKTKIALIFQNDPYYEEFIAFFKKAAQAEGITIISEDLVNPGTSDFKTTFSKIKAKSGDGIVFGMYDEKTVTSFLKDHKLIIPSVALYSNEVIRQYVESNKDYLPYIEGSVFVENAQLTQSFVDKYKKVYSTDPVLSASTAYDTTMVLADTLINGGNDPVNYLKSHSFNTVSFGKITLDSLGGVVTTNKQYQIRQVKDGKIEPI